MANSMNISAFLRANEEFQSSVNIAYDLGDRSKVKGLIPTSGVCRYVEALLSDVIFKSTNRAKFFVGAYGKGKSHIALASLAAMSVKEPPLYQSLISAYRQIGNPFSEVLTNFVADGQLLLPVVISGSSADLARSFLYALSNALKDAQLDELMPKTNYGGALDTVVRWRKDYPATYKRMEELLGAKGALIEAKLSNYDTKTYLKFIEAYPELTSGGVFDTLANADVVETYSHVVKDLRRYGYSGIYVVFDEFSKYLESSIQNATIEDVKLLQDFAEACNRSSQQEQMHLLLISHKNLSNYIDSSLPKEKVDGWRGVSGRFQEVEVRDNPNQSYELMTHAIAKDPQLWTDSLYHIERDLTELRSRYIASGLLDAENADAVVYGCYPLHPLTAYLLPRVSELVAQNERTLFTFLAASESNALPARAERGDIEGRYVTPDIVYDYFEPLLRKEQFGTRAHELYALARSALSHLDSDCLESKIVKTVALIHLVAQFNQLPPTKEMAAAPFVDTGIDLRVVDEAIEELLATDSIIYLRRSDSRLKLKEASGIKIEDEIDNKAEILKTKTTVEEILNRFQNGRALYPSRHNHEKKTTRYFDCYFMGGGDVVMRLSKGAGFDYTGDGAVLAVLPDDAATLEDIGESLRSAEAKTSTVVFAVPKEIEEIADIAYGYEAALTLRDEAADDEVLRDEYSIVAEDYSEILSRFVSKYYWPEKNSVVYYYNGHRKNGINHRRKLSGLLSEICDKVYSKTPIINNEVINKNEPTGIALTSRAKILAALCSKNLEPNLGFIGNGQETSIARSVLGVTGIIESLDTEPVVSIDHKNPNVGAALATIEDYLANSQRASFETLYERLTSPAYGIGAKLGPIPILLAVVLRKYRDAVCIMHGNDEVPVDKKTLEDIESSPQNYTVSLVDWDDEKAAYVSEIGLLFGAGIGSLSKTQVVDQARSWFVSLPQFTRLSKINHASMSKEPFDIEHCAFFKALNQPTLNVNQFLFETLPQAFGCPMAGMKLTQKVRREIAACDSYIDNVVDAISAELQILLSPSASQRETLHSSVSTWLDSLAPQTRRHVFSGSGSRIMSALENFTPDTSTSIMRLCKAAVSLRIEDWDDDLYADFIANLHDFVEEVDSFESNREDSTSIPQSIVYLSSDGKEEALSFDHVDCSPRAKLLKNQIVSSLDEMGQSITNDEKRQVLFDVLKEMCI